MSHDFEKKETKELTNYQFKQIFSQEELSCILTKGLREAYEDAFNRFPYNETFQPGEIDTMFYEYFHNGYIFVVSREEQIIAFSSAVPIVCVPDIASILIGQKGVSESSWYLPDVGVRHAYEGKGIVKTLMKKTLEILPQTSVTLRTSEDNIRAQGLYSSLGFITMPELRQEIPRPRMNGRVESDRRLFMLLRR